MDSLVEMLARVVVLAACLTQVMAGLAVLVRQVRVRRPAPAERLRGPLGLVNYAGLAGFVLVASTVAITGIGTVVGSGEGADAVRAGGIVVLWAAGLLAAWGVRAMGRNLVAPAEVRPDTELITDGPFGLVRHPLYDSIVLLWAGGALALLSPVMAVIAAAMVPAIDLRAAAEERILARHFGDRWTEYSARVPMLLPAFGRRGR